MSPKRQTQRACAVTVYRLSTDPHCREKLVEHGGIRSVIALLHRHHNMTSAQTPAEASDGTGTREGVVVVPPTSRTGSGSAPLFSTLLSRETMLMSQLEREEGRGLGMGLGLSFPLEAGSASGLDTTSTNSVGSSFAAGQNAASSKRCVRQRRVHVRIG
jgi:hypothetical protein